MARQLSRGCLAAAVAAGLMLSLAACDGFGSDEPANASTCDLLPRQEVADALALPGQDAADLELTGTTYNPDAAGAGADANECTAGDPSVATLRAVSIKATADEIATDSDQDIVGTPCTDFEPLPDSVDAVGGTCLTVSTEVRGRWGDKRITVQLYRAAGKQPADRDTVIGIAQKFHEATESQSS